MANTKIKNLTLPDRERISNTREAFRSIGLGDALFNLATGVDEATIKAERITAHYNNTGLSFVVGNSTLAITNAGLTMFLNVGGTNSFGSDGVDTFAIIAGTLTKLT